MKGGLTRRLALSFSGALLAFALMMGTLFAYFFLGYIEAHHLEDLERSARAMAEGMKERPEAVRMMGMAEGAPAEDGTALMGRQKMGMRHHGYRGHRQEMERVTDGEAGSSPEHSQRMEPMQPGMYCCRSFCAGGGSTGGDSLGQYLKELNDLSRGEVWVLDAHTRTFNLYGEEGETQYDELPSAADDMVQRTLRGETVASRDFTPLLAAPTITVGTPVYGEDGSILGALFMHRTLTELQEAQKQALLLFGLCLAIALAAAFLLSLFLARRFIHPLKRMEAFAGELAAGNYGLRSGVRQEDEIGSLAASLDALAQRLEEGREQKARLDRMRQDFFANISHELRTPITVLRGTLELLSSGLVKDEEKRQGHLRQMMAQLLGLQRLVQDLFELAKLQNADFALETSEMNLMDALQDAIQAARQMASPKGIAIEVSAEQPPILLEGDYGRLRQMFLAILDNAVKFSPEQGKIFVETNIGTDGWRIAICDQGCGIPAEELPHIFERFQSSRGSKNKSGTGLGLPIAREIARRHGIDLSCTSVEGEGASFVLKK